MAINLNDYMTANPSFTTTQALQACVATRQRVDIPPTSGYRTIEQPILFESYLACQGENQVQVANTSNLLAGNFQGRPMFLGGKYVSGNFTGWYLDCDGVYRIVYKGATPSGADTNFSASYTTDKVANLKTLEVSHFGVETFQLDRLLLSNTDSYGSIINTASPMDCSFTNLGIQSANRGIHLGSSFTCLLQSINFQAHLPDWLWMDSAVWARIKAGNGTAEDLAIKAAIDARLANAWGLYVGGNSHLINARFVGWGTGLAINGNGSYATGPAIEKCFNGLVMGGLPFLDINTLAARTLETNYLVSGLPPASNYSPEQEQQAYVTDSTIAHHLGLGNIVVGGGGFTALVYSDGTNWRIGNKPPEWGTQGGFVNGLDMESCYRGVIIKNCNTTLARVTAIGHAANQYDGTVGEVEYGIGVAHMTAPYEQINSVVNDGGNESVRSILLPNATSPVIEINETVLVRQKLANLDARITTETAGLATEESVEAVNQRVTALDAASVSNTDLDTLNTIVSDTIYPRS